MYKEQRVLCIIPARGGSKRLPGKNIKPLNGKPLIVYAIEAAKGSAYIDRVIVTTDDQNIADVAKEAGAEIPFMRPADLASDTATSLSVLQHAIAFLENAEADGEGGARDSFDLIVLIQPTVPGVLTADVDEAIQKIMETEANSCVSVCEITDRPEFMYHRGSDARITPFMESQTMRTQDMPELFRINGAVYVTRHDVVMIDNKIIDTSNASSTLMPRERSVDIDTELDFTMAGLFLRSSK